MNRFLTIKQIKGIAKEQLLGKFGPIVLSMITYFSMQVTLALISLIAPQGTILGIILYQIISFASDIIFGLIQVGLATYFLNVATNKTFLPLQLFDGFRKNPERTLKIATILAVITFLCSAPGEALSILMQLKVVDFGKYSDAVLILTFALFAGIRYIILLNYNLVYYLIVDLEDVSYDKIIKLSFWLMKGNRMRFFLLQLSFLPIYLLGVITFGIGLLWIIPYMNTAYAYFYLDLSSKKSR